MPHVKRRQSAVCTHSVVFLLSYPASPAGFETSDVHLASSRPSSAGSAPDWHAAPVPHANSRAGRPTRERPSLLHDAGEIHLYRAMSRDSHTAVHSGRAPTHRVVTHTRSLQGSHGGVREVTPRRPPGCLSHRGGPRMTQPDATLTLNRLCIDASSHSSDGRPNLASCQLPQTPGVTGFSSSGRPLEAAAGGGWLTAGDGR